MRSTSDRSRARNLQTPDLPLLRGRCHTTNPRQLWHKQWWKVGIYEHICRRGLDRFGLNATFNIFMVSFIGGSTRRKPLIYIHVCSFRLRYVKLGLEPSTLEVSDIPLDQGGRLYHQNPNKGCLLSDWDGTQMLISRMMSTCSLPRPCQSPDLVVRT